MNKYCILVLYNPNLEVVEETIRILIKESVIVFIVDNTPINDGVTNNISLEIDCKNYSNIKFLERKGNQGLSSAYNMALNKISESPGFKNINDCVLFLDQDSLINENDIQKLFNAFENVSDDVAIIGGNPIRRDGFAYRDYKNDFNEVNIVISSFSIIRLNVLEKFDFFQSDFFIDHIDVDFCSRCLKDNLKILIMKDAKFIQPIGEKEFKLFGKYLFPIPSTNRTYYQIRNAILSYKRGGVDFLFLLREFRNRMIITILSGLSEKDIFPRLRLFSLGVYHGVKNQGGRLKI